MRIEVKRTGPHVCYVRDGDVIFLGSGKAVRVTEEFDIPSPIDEMTAEEWTVLTASPRCSECGHRRVLHFADDANTGCWACEECFGFVPQESPQDSPEVGVDYQA